MSSYPAIKIQNKTDSDPIEILYDYNNQISVIGKKRHHFEIISPQNNACYFQEELFTPLEIRLTGPLHSKESDNHTHELVIKHTNDINDHLYMVFFIYNDSLPNYMNLFSLNSHLDRFFDKPMEKEEIILQSILSPQLEKLNPIYYQTKNKNHIILFPNAIYTSQLPLIQYTQNVSLSVYKEVYVPNNFDILQSIFSLNDDTKIHSIIPQGVQLRLLLSDEMEGFRSRRRRGGGGGKKRRQRRRRRDAAKGAAFARGAEDYVKEQIKNLVPGYVTDEIKSSIARNQTNIKTMTLPNNYMECDLLEDNGKDVYKDTIVMPLGSGAYEQGATMFMSFLYFFLIGAVISIGSPYLTLIAIKHEDDSYSKALTIVWGIILFLGVILVAIALAPKTKVIDKNGKETVPPALKKLTKKKRILLSTLGFFFMIMFGFSFLSNSLAKMSGMSYGPHYSFETFYTKKSLTTTDIFDIYGWNKPKAIN